VKISSLPKIKVDNQFLLNLRMNQIAEMAEVDGWVVQVGCAI